MNDFSNDEILIPAGFSFSGTSCGIKKSGSRDLGLIVADQPADVFGSFTQNVVRASSVDWNESRVGIGRAIVINSGNANACTGSQGEQDTRSMAEAVAELLPCDPSDVFVMSTGIIGEPLPMEKVRKGIHAAIPALASHPQSVEEFAGAMMTTDRFSKICSREFKSDVGTFRVLGIAKGAGMIAPNMATMLGVVCTDYPFSGTNENRQAFQSIIEKTFNSISVDGHTSTSDQVLLLSSKQNSEIPDRADDSFLQNLLEVCRELAKKIPADGEGATHLISIEVKGPQPEVELHEVARTIASSPLVKTAVFGGDPNWGRIVSAAGYSGIPFEPAETSLKVNGHLLYQQGTPVSYDPTKVSQSMKDQFETSIELQLAPGSNSAQFWTSDLTYDYVKINAEYHT